MSSLNYEVDIKPYIDKGVTAAADIANGLVSSRLTHRDIDITSNTNQEDSIVQLFSIEYGLMTMDPDTQGWIGPLVALSKNNLMSLYPAEHPLHATANAINTALQAQIPNLRIALTQIAPLLQIQSQTLTSSTTVTSALALYLVTEIAKALAPILPLPVPPTSEQIDARLNGIHGGRRYDDIVESDVQSCIDQWTADQASTAEQRRLQSEVDKLQNEFQLRWNQNISPLIDGQNETVADWVAAIQNMATTFQDPNA